MDNDLKEWTKAYIKNRDSVQKKLVKIDEDIKKNIIIAQYKDKIVKHHILDVFDEKSLKLIENNDSNTIICPNVEANFQFLVKHWKILSAIKNLNIIFVNLKVCDKWQINPHVHSMIADPDSIETGLRTMFDTANGNITEIKASKKKQPMFEETSIDDKE
jgi:hypothetical protein